MEKTGRLMLSEQPLKPLHTSRVSSPYSLQLRALGPTQNIFNRVTLCFSFSGVKTGTQLGLPHGLVQREAQPRSMDMSFCHFPWLSPETHLCIPCLFRESFEASEAFLVKH